MKNSETNCKICKGLVSKIFDTIVLNKYTVSYYQCIECLFIQTENPYWLPEAYSSAITSLDVGLLYRNIGLSIDLPPILNLISDQSDSFLDYGGGYGVLVRIMRDKGYDFYLHDPYAENLFAKHFELYNYKKKSKFAVLTAFEVFEHLNNPIEELLKMFKYTDTIIFSTELQPSETFNKPSEWWYFAPETGQHISFYSKKSLAILANQMNLYFYTNNLNLHVLTKIQLNSNLLDRLYEPKLSILERTLLKLGFVRKPKLESFKRSSYLQSDFELYKSLCFA